MIALHKEFCDSPADILCRPSSEDSGVLTTSAVFPFPISGCLALLKGTDEYRASIKRFNLCHSSMKKMGCQQLFRIFQKISVFSSCLREIDYLELLCYTNIYFSVGDCYGL